tara:strand:+ start:16 stop:693 length:678 start_codon:yes stop_codon:yes gene_type:complete
MRIKSFLILFLLISPSAKTDDSDLTVWRDSGQTVYGGNVGGEPRYYKYEIRVDPDNPSNVQLATSSSNENAVKPALQIFLDGFKRNDLILVSKAAYRCGALHLTVSEILRRDTSDTETAKKFKDSGGVLSLLAMTTEGYKLKHRGKKNDPEDLQRRALSQIELYTEMYGERIKKNQFSSGDMFSSDPLMTQDMQDCNLLTGILSSEDWLETMETNDWSNWNDVLQ